MRMHSTCPASLIDEFSSRLKPPLHLYLARCSGYLDNNYVRWDGRWGLSVAHHLAQAGDDLFELFLRQAGEIEQIV